MLVSAGVTVQRVRRLQRWRLARTLRVVWQGYGGTRGEVALVADTPKPVSGVAEGGGVAT